MKKMLYILCFIFVLINNLYAKEEYFVLVEFQAPSMADKSLSYINIYPGFVNKDKNGILTQYTKTSCFNKLKNKVLESLKYGAEYYDNGVYYDRGYGRYACLEYNIAEKYLDKEFKDMLYLQKVEYDKNDNPIYSLTKFSKDFPNAIPYIVKEEDIKNYTIFPLMKNQKEARKLSDKLNKEIKKELEKNK